LIWLYLPVSRTRWHHWYINCCSWKLHNVFYYFHTLWRRHRVTMTTIVYWV